jgi:hypothetical protein
MPAQHDMNAISTMIAVTGCAQRLMKVAHEMEKTQDRSTDGKEKLLIGDYLCRRFPSLSVLRRRPPDRIQLGAAAQER